MTKLLVFGVYLGECHDLYLKTDVLLLANVFEKFIKTCLDYYRLDPCHYFSAPGLSWDAMLRMTGIDLELYSDTYMHLFIEKGIKGGISYICKRYSSINESNKEKNPFFIGMQIICVDGE